MPTKRLSKSSIAGDRTESKENIINPLLLGKAARGRNMARKRSRSDPGDSSSAGEAVLRLAQEANNSERDVDAAKGTDQTNGVVSSSRNINGARLYAQSVQKANTLKSGNPGKKLKISPDDNSVGDQASSEDGKAVTTSVSASASLSRMSINGFNRPEYTVSNDTYLKIKHDWLGKLL